MMLDAGDIAFFGEGPEDTQWWIGIEYKTIDDVVACIKSGRFTGTQLPGMMRIYDLCFLLVEGIPRPDRHSGQLVRYRGKAVYGCGLHYSAFDNFLTSVNTFSSLAGKPCIVKMAGTDFETVQMIRNIYSLFQKPWGSHKSMSRPDQSKIHNVSYDMEVVRVEPGEPDYPKYVLRKALFQIKGIGWDVSGVLSDKFQTMENALTVSTKDWQDIEHIGSGLAKRIYESLHGHVDPAIKLRRSRRNEISMESACTK